MDVEDRPQEWQVVVGGAIVGRVVIDERGGDLVVLEAELVAPDHVAVLGSLLDCRALATGAGRVVLDGDAGALGALVASGWAEPASERLGLALDGPAETGSGLRLAPMGAESFAAFRERLAQGYVRERAGSGESADQARRTMQAQLGRLLPHDLDSPDQHLFTGWDGDRVVGHLWIGTERPGAFVYYVEVAREERRRGYGRALMVEAARWSREHGHDHLRLNVFAHNIAARALYAALGYRTEHATHRRVVGVDRA